ncbi:MAG: tetratricopeptide repeat protein [Gemmataceae bacterium]|nr:tetratricopeptide repeat protein [Gemmataceae bacterium]
MAQQTTLDKIQSLCDLGDGYLNADQFAEALEKYREAATLIPEPFTEHQLALSVYTAIGEAHLFAGQHQQSLEAFQKAMNAQGAIENPLAHLRLGQAYFEVGRMDDAADELTRAYMLDGRDVFDGEDDKYLAFLATRITL